MRLESAVYVPGLSLVKYDRDFRNSTAEEHIQVLSFAAHIKMPLQDA
jgi:hypothetical protein